MAAIKNDNRLQLSYVPHAACTHWRRWTDSAIRIHGQVWVSGHLQQINLWGFENKSDNWGGYFLNLYNKISYGNIFLKKDVLLFVLFFFSLCCTLTFPWILHVLGSWCCNQVLIVHQVIKHFLLSNETF